MTFCTDVDLLYWEPRLFIDAAAVAQQLFAGSGNLSGSTFTISSGSLTANHVEADQVAALSDTIAGSYAITQVTSATTLVLSTIYDGLAPDDGSSPVANPIGTASGLTISIATFWPQRRVASDLLKSAAGLGPSSISNQSGATILNPEALRRACVLGSLQMIYNALATAIPANTITPYSVRSDTYAKLFRSALLSTNVEVDLNGDGKADDIRPLSLVRFVRI